MLKILSLVFCSFTTVHLGVVVLFSILNEFLQVEDSYLSLILENSVFISSIIVWLILSILTCRNSY